MGTYYTLSSGTVGNALLRGALLRGVRNTIQNDSSRERANTSAYVPMTLSSGWESSLDQETLLSCHLLVSDILQKHTAAIPSVPELLRGFRADAYSSDESWIAEKVDEHTLRLWFSPSEVHKTHLIERKDAALVFMRGLREQSLAYLANLEGTATNDRAKQAISSFADFLRPADLDRTDVGRACTVAGLLRASLKQEPLPVEVLSSYKSNSAFSGIFYKPHMFLLGTCVTADINVSLAGVDDEGYSMSSYDLSLKTDRDLSLLFSNTSADLEQAFLDWFDMPSFQEKLRSGVERRHKYMDMSLLVAMRYLLTDAVTVHLADSASYTATTQTATALALDRLRSALSTIFGRAL